MKEILLTQGKVALVDDEDFNYLNQFKWCADKARNTYYAFRRMKINGRWTVGTMHQFLINQQKGMQVDHADDNGLNNQKYNLRICTNQQNHMKSQIQKTSNGKLKTSAYKGVSLDCRLLSKRWISVIVFNNKQQHLGRFKTEEEAAFTYNNAAIKLFGEFARLNRICF